MRRGRRQQNIKDFTSGQLLQHGTWLMYNRWRLLAPHPFEPKAVRDALLTDGQHKAIQLLTMTMPSCLVRTSEVNVVFDRPVAITTKNGQIHEAKFLTLNLPNAEPMPTTMIYRGVPVHRFELTSLPKDMQEGLVEWARNWLTHQSETAEVLAKFTRLFGVCGTLGQVVRVWPQVKSLLTELAQQTLAEAKVKSPYPEAVLVRSSDWDDTKGNYKLLGLKDEWTPEALQWYDDRLTEALCLPEVYTKEDAVHNRWPLEVNFTG